MAFEMREAGEVPDSEIAALITERMVQIGGIQIPEYQKSSPLVTSVLEKRLPSMRRKDGFSFTKIGYHSYHELYGAVTGEIADDRPEGHTLGHLKAGLAIEHATNAIYENAPEEIVLETQKPIIGYHPGTEKDTEFNTELQSLTTLRGDEATRQQLLEDRVEISIAHDIIEAEVERGVHTRECAAYYAKNLGEEELTSLKKEYYTVLRPDGTEVKVSRFDYRVISIGLGSMMNRSIPPHPISKEEFDDLKTAIPDIEIGFEDVNNILIRESCAITHASDWEAFTSGGYVNKEALDPSVTQVSENAEENSAKTAELNKLLDRFTLAALAAENQVENEQVYAKSPYAEPTTPLYTYYRGNFLTMLNKVDGFYSAVQAYMEPIRKMVETSHEYGTSEELANAYERRFSLGRHLPAIGSFNQEINRLNELDTKSFQRHLSKLLHLSMIRIEEQRSVTVEEYTMSDDKLDEYTRQLIFEKGIRYFEERMKRATPEIGQILMYEPVKGGPVPKYISIIDDLPGSEILQTQGIYLDREADAIPDTLRTYVPTSPRSTKANIEEEVNRIMEEGGVASENLEARRAIELAVTSGVRTLEQFLMDEQNLEPDVAKRVASEWMLGAHSTHLELFIWSTSAFYQSLLKNPENQDRLISGPGVGFTPHEIMVNVLTNARSIDKDIIIPYFDGKVGEMPRDLIIELRLEGQEDRLVRELVMEKDWNSRLSKEGILSQT